MKFIRAPFHPSVTHFMGMLHDLGGEYRPQLILPEEKKQHTSGRREDRREPRMVPREPRRYHRMADGSICPEVMR